MLSKQYTMIFYVKFFSIIPRRSYLHIDSENQKYLSKQGSNLKKKSEISVEARH